MQHRLGVFVIAACLFCLLDPASLSAQGGDSASQKNQSTGLRFPIAEWKYQVGDSTEMSAVEYDDSSWTAVQLPGRVKPGGSLRVFWLRTRFEIPAEAPDRLWFLTKNDGAVLELFVDGLYCGGRGEMPPNYDLRAFRSEAFLLPVDRVRPGSTISLALRCVYKGSAVNMPVFEIGDKKARDFDIKIRNFWNGQLYSILAALCVFLALYSIAKFIFKPSERVELYFAASLGFITLYLLDLGAEFWIFTAPWSRAFARASLLISMTFLVPFFTTFFDFLQKRIITYASVAVGVGVTAAYMLVSNDEAACQTVFSVALLPVFTAIILCGYISLRAAVKGAPEAWPIVAAVVLGLAFAVYDSYYSIQGMTPFFWLQGIAFFLLNISVFVAQSIRQARMKNKLETYAAEMAAQKTELDTSIRAMNEAGRAAADISERLDEAAARAASAAQETAQSSEGIRGDTERQAAEAKTADDLVAKLVSSIGKVTENLGRQGESAERTAAAATELSATAGSVAQSVGHAARFTIDLASMTEEGDRAAASLAATMHKVSEASKGIAEVVDAVNEFAERTNLLAMNAAIEAAHSGHSGRGFAVIAGEVKSLAASQTERAAQIKDIVAEIQKGVAEGGENAALLSATIRKIAHDSSEAADKLRDVMSATEEQNRAANEISLSVESLVASIASIQAEAERQSEFSAKVRAAVAAIAEDAARVKTTARSIAEQGAGLVHAVASLKELSAKGGRLTAVLAGGKPDGE